MVVGRFQSTFFSTSFDSPSAEEAGHGQRDPEQRAQPELGAGTGHGAILPPSGVAGPARRPSLARCPPLVFSKWLERLEDAVALHIAYFNFSWRPSSMKGETPAMAAGLSPRPAIPDQQSRIVAALPHHKAAGVE